MGGNMENSRRLVIFSALYGDYLHGFHALPNLDIDAYAFTDNIKNAAEGWRTMYMPCPKDVHPRLQAKWFKMFPHKLFPEYEYSLWIDAGWKWTGDQIVAHTFQQFFPSYLKENALCFLPHRRNKNLQEELYETMGLEKYVGLPAPSQVASYYADGYKDENGIIEGTMILRKHNHPDAVRFNEAWWCENKKWTYCDQLSAPYVLWKEKIDFSLFPFNLSEQRYFSIAEWRGDK